MEETETNLVTLTEAAQRLQVSGDRARRMVLVGRLDGKQVAGRWLVTPSSVEKTRAELAECTGSAA